MGQRARIKELRRKAVAVVLAQRTTAARLSMVHELHQHGVFNTKKSREVLDLPRDSTT
jgi:hypothetical protein